MSGVGMQKEKVIVAPEMVSGEKHAKRRVYVRRCGVGMQPCRVQISDLRADRALRVEEVGCTRRT